MNPDLSTLSTYFNVFWQFSAYFKSYKKLRLYSWHTWNTLKDVEKRVEKRWNSGTVVPVRFVSTYFMYFTKFQRMSTHLSTFFNHISTEFRRFSTKFFKYSTRFQEILVLKNDEKCWKMLKNDEIQFLSFNIFHLNYLRKNTSILLKDGERCWNLHSYLVWAVPKRHCTGHAPPKLHVHARLHAARSRAGLQARMVPSAPAGALRPGRHPPKRQRAGRTARSAVPCPASGLHGPVRAGRCSAPGPRPAQTAPCAPACTLRGPG